MFNNNSEVCSMLFKKPETSVFQNMAASNTVTTPVVPSVPVLPSVFTATPVVPTGLPSATVLPSTTLCTGITSVVPDKVISMDKQTQTTTELIFNRLHFSSKHLHEKSKAVCILSCLKPKLYESYASKYDASIIFNELDNLVRNPTTCIPINYNMMGIHSFIKLSKDDLCLKYNKFDKIAIIHTQVLHELIDETIHTSDQLYNFIFTITTDKTLQYALKLAKYSNGSFLPFEPLTDDYWTECFSVAIAIFAADKGAQDAIFTASQLMVSNPKAKELTISMLCDMVGCSYGIFDKSILTKDMADIIYLSKKLVG